MPIKITEPVRSKALRRPFEPSVIRDSELSGFRLIVTRRRGFFALEYQPRGLNPSTGKRWGGGVRHELGDAMLTTVAEARTAALAAKALVRAGRSPHHEAMASRASAVAARGILPTTVDEGLTAYAAALMTYRRPSERTRKQSIRYARLACTLMNANSVRLAVINAPAIRLMLETVSGADAQRKHIYGGLNRFLAWCRKQGLIEINPCDALDRQDRPKPGKARAHVPSIKTLRGIWAAADGEPAGDLLRFLLLTPLRRNEASGLRWSEVDLDQGCICIAADRMKAREAHELPLSQPARAILEARLLTRAASDDLVFPFAEGAPFSNWDRLLARVRKTIGEDRNERDARVSIHDFRRAFVSHLAGRFDLDALDQCLGHKRRGVAGVYQRSKRWPERVDALNAYAALILDACEHANVVPFPMRAHV